jgi:hypothetical protein
LVLHKFNIFKRLRFVVNSGLKLWHNRAVDKSVHLKMEGRFQLKLEFKFKLGYDGLQTDNLWFDGDNLGLGAIVLPLALIISSIKRCLRDSATMR